MFSGSFCKSLFSRAPTDFHPNFVEDKSYTGYIPPSEPNCKFVLLRHINLPDINRIESHSWHKVLALDIDGTILDCKSSTYETIFIQESRLKKTIQDAHRANILVILVTARVFQDQFVDAGAVSLFRILPHLSDGISFIYFTSTKPKSLALNHLSTILFKRFSAIDKQKRIVLVDDDPFYLNDCQCNGYGVIKADDNGCHLDSLEKWMAATAHLADAPTKTLSVVAKKENKSANSKEIAEKLQQKNLSYAPFRLVNFHSSESKICNTEDDALDVYDSSSCTIC